MVLASSSQRETLSRLLPLVVDTDQTAGSAGKTNNAIVELGPGQGGRGNDNVAQIGRQLEMAGSALPMILTSQQTEFLPVMQMKK